MTSAALNINAAKVKKSLYEGNNYSIVALNLTN